MSVTITHRELSDENNKSTLKQLHYH